MIQCRQYVTHEHLEIDHLTAEAQWSAEEWMMPGAQWIDLTDHQHA